MTKPKRVRVRSEAERTRHNIKQNAARLKARGGVEIVSLRSILMSLIAEKAATETGFASLDAGDNFKYAADICGELVKSGALFKAQIKRRVFYFTTPEAANARVAKQTATPKPRKQHKLTPLVTHPQHALVMQTKPSPGLPKIKQPVEIIYPERYLKISRPWIDPRAVIVPMRRIGQPGWSMSVGGPF